MDHSTEKRADLSGARALLFCGVLQGPLWVGVVFVLGATRSDYDPLRQSTSTLALGEWGWVQIANFVVTGLLTLAFAVGAWRFLRASKGMTLGPALIGVWSAAMVGAGVFVTDPRDTYPSGTSGPSGSSVLHDMFAGLGFLAIVAAFLVFARWFRRRQRRIWAFYCVATAVVCLVTVILASYGWGRSGGIAEWSGLFQRISVVTAHVWLTAVATHLLLGVRGG